MTTQSLRGMANHGPMHWRGDRTGGNDAPSAQPDGGAFDEVAAFKKFNVAFVGLLGRSGQLTHAEMQAFTDFILQVTYPPNPIRKLDNSLTGGPAGGPQLLLRLDSVRRRSARCNGCHALDTARSRLLRHRRRSSVRGRAADVQDPAPAQPVPEGRHVRHAAPTGLFGFNAGDNGFKGDQVRGFGFLHDGSVDTLFRFLDLTGFNQSGGNPGGFLERRRQRRQIEQFMLAFDSNLAPIVGQQITLTCDQRARSSGRASTC